MYRAIIHLILRCSLLMTVLAAAPACAEQGFDNVAGSWSGSGSMKPSDGARERVRCKVDYNVRNAGQSVKMNVRCASDAYKMDLSANIDQNGTALSGNWFESQYRQGGKVSGQNVDGLRGESRERNDCRVADRSHQRQPANLRHGSTRHVGFAGFDRPCSRLPVNRSTRKTPSHTRCRPRDSGDPYPQMLAAATCARKGNPRCLSHDRRGVWVPAFRRDDQYL